jgi:subtilase family serine protease
MPPAIPNRNAKPQRPLSVFFMLYLLLATLSVTAWAAQPDRIVAPIDNNQTVVLKGNVSPKAQQQYDQGLVDPSMKLPFVTLLIQPSADQQAALKQLLAEQQDPSSPNYHKWLTPEQFGQRFGLSSADIVKITRWLRSQGFGIVQVARGRDWVAFGGTVAQVQRAFHTELHRYNVDGEERFANATDPSIPKALDSIVAGFRGLNNFRLEPMNVKKSDAIDIRPDYFSGGGNYLAPGDIATIYDIGPLYTAGIDGTGMKIAILGQTDIYAADIAQFRSAFGLTANVPQQILATGCTHPGVTGDLAEADIDLEWSGAVARNATIFFVICDPNNGGVGTSAQYAIDNDVAPVISMSYGICESTAGQGNATEFQTMVQKGNTEGITFLSSSGDSGAASCDSSGSSSATQGLAVNFPASVPEVTAIGGTELNEGSGSYWGTTNGANGGSALSYIPELAWDDNSTGTGFDPHLASTGGGVSIYFPKPSWQTGPGVPSNSFRNVPDVAMSASADHDGYIVCTNDGCAGGIQGAGIYGGTSVATPIFAGIVTLLNQQMKNTPPAGLGNVNTILYQFAQSMPTAFHDVPAGNYNNGGAANPSGNTVPCTQGSTSCPAKAPFQFGFLTGAGYDQVTGLGSVDAHVFVTNFANAVKIPTTTTVTLSPASVNVGATGPVMAKATVTHATGTGTPSGTVNFYVDGSTTAAGSGTLSSGSFTFNYNPTALPKGNHTITATYAGDSAFAGSTSAGATLGVQDFTITPIPTTVTVTAPGLSGTTILTITPFGGFTQTVTYTCAGLPSEAACTFPTAATGGTLTITTTAPSARMDKSPLGPSKGLFYALLLPGFLGLIVSAGSHKRTRRSIRLLSFIAVLALSTFSMPACGGGSSSGPSNPGTPAGTSTVTLTATAGSISHNAKITLTIQ